MHVWTFTHTHLHEKLVDFPSNFVEKIQILYDLLHLKRNLTLLFKKLAGLLLTDLVTISQILKFYYYFWAELKYFVDTHQKELKKSPL